MMGSRSTRALRALILSCSAFVYCTPPPPAIVIDSPTMGAFINSATTTVTGHLLNTSYLVANGQVTVNGAAVTLNPDLTFSTTIALDATKVFNPITAVLFPSATNPTKSRITVMRGQGLAEGSFASNSVGLRINDTGLNSLEPQITSLVPLNLATLLPPGTLVIDNYCYQNTIFGCLGRVDVTIANNPPPSMSGYSINADSQTNQVQAVVSLNNLFVKAKVVAVSGIGFTCYFNITASQANITGNYSLEPAVSDPTNVDVNQLGNVSVGTIGFSDGGGADCDGFFGGLVSLLIGLFVPDVQGLVTNGLVSFLADPDGAGPNDATIAEAIETALSGISIAGAIGSGIGVNLEAPLAAVPEDVNGLALKSNSRMTILTPNPNAANPTSSLSYTESFPSYGPTAPNGQAYGVGIGISTTAFNQLLRTQIEGGLLLTNLTSLDLFGGGPVPITSTVLGLFEPRFALLGPNVPLTLAIKPMVAPVVTTAAGPAGEISELRAGHVAIDVVSPQGIVVSFIVDVRTGLNLGFDSGTNSLSFQLGTPAIPDIAIEIVNDQIDVNENNLALILPQLFAALFPSLASSLATFPLPEFLGLNFQIVQIHRTGSFFTLYTNLVP